MVSQASSPAPILDEDSRRFFKVIYREISLKFNREKIHQDFITNHRFNAQTFQLNLANLTEDEGSIRFSSTKFRFERFFFLLCRIEISRYLCSIEQSGVRS